MTTTYYVDPKTGPKGFVSGYVVKDNDGRVVATYLTRDHGYWRFAKDKAWAKCNELNAAVEG